MGLVVTFIGALVTTVWFYSIVLEGQDGWGNIYYAAPLPIFLLFNYVNFLVFKNPDTTASNHFKKIGRAYIILSLVITIGNELILTLSRETYKVNVFDFFGTLVGVFFIGTASGLIVFIINQLLLMKKER